MRRGQAPPAPFSPPGPASSARRGAAEDLPLDVREAAHEVAARARDPDLALAVVAPGGEGAAHAERGRRVEVIDLVVDEGDLGEPDREAARELLEVRGLADPDLLVEHAVRREEVAQAPAAQEPAHREAVLRRGDREHDLARAPAQHAGEDR